MARGFKYMPGWDPDHMNLVKSAFVGAQDMIFNSYLTLIRTPESDRSIQRYFTNEDLPTVKHVLELTMGFLATPGAEIFRDCKESLRNIHQLELFDGDQPGMYTTCRSGHTYAYQSDFELNGEKRHSITFCQKYFDRFRAHKVRSTAPEFPAVRPDRVGIEVDSRYLGELPLTYSGASIFLHEVLHYGAITSEVFGSSSITDTVVTRPADNQDIVAYGCYYSNKILDPSWRARHPQVLNDENYMCVIRELYYRTLYNLGWLEPMEPDTFIPVKEEDGVL